VSGARAATADRRAFSGVTLSGSFIEDPIRASKCSHPHWYRALAGILEVEELPGQPAAVTTVQPSLVLELAYN
jgi:hypothetical protein